VAHIDDSFEKKKSLMLKFRMEMLPVLNDDNEIVEIHFWNEVFSEEYSKHLGSLSLPVVIMAGGKGTRLKPITNIIPKALVPIEEKPIVQVIIDKFYAMGSRSFIMSVNYKAEMIRSYLAGVDKDYELEFVYEEKPLGTAGSLHLMTDKLKGTFFVTNCDIIIEDDYEQIYNYHKKECNDLTVVAAIKNYPIPYGILETKEQGQLTGIVGET
jgi:NDP-sugar pyrophosphorylase family protein